jgi:hypothetical protein
VFDLPFILTHPLLKSIFTRCAELSQQAAEFPEGSAQKKALEKRLSRLERRRGRPEELPIQTRAAFEEKLAHPEMTWRQLAAKYGVPGSPGLGALRAPTQRCFKARGNTASR